MRIRANAVSQAVVLLAVSWNIQLAAQPLDLGRSSVAQAKEPAIHAPDAHGQDPLAANGAWFREFKRDVSNEPADPHSDQMLARLRKAKGTINAQWSGSWTPSDWNWYTWPFQVVRGNVAPLTIPGTWAYNPASKGPYLLPPEPVVYENRRQTTYATAKWTDGADHHLCIYVRDEASGGYKELWEYYQPWVTRKGNQITAVAGASWRKFDLLKGEVPAAGVPATDAAGLMIMPLVVRYDEVARGSIKHALRFCVNNSDISPTFKWPAQYRGGRMEPRERHAVWHAAPHQGVLVERQRRRRAWHQHPSPHYRRGDAPLRSHSGGRLRRFYDPASRGGGYALGEEACQPAECHTGGGVGSGLDAAPAANYRPDQAPGRSSGDLDHDLLAQRVSGRRRQYHQHLGSEQ